MRSSSAVLTDSSVRLWDLVFPSGTPLLSRTRAAYIHLDNLIAHSKRDRDGKVDAYLACYRPDETVLLFFDTGDLVNAAVMAPVGRFPISISEAMKHLKAEPERSEISYHAVDTDCLASMYAACALPPAELGIDSTSPSSVFGKLLETKWSGVLELISKGFVSYVTVKDGRFAVGHFGDPKKGEKPAETVARIFTAPPPEPRPKVAVRAFSTLAAVPHQAPPAMVKVFREFYWNLSERADKEGGDAAKRAERVRNRLTSKHEVLKSVGGPRGSAPADPIVEPAMLCEAVAEWAKEFLQELEVIQPDIAPRLLKDAAREPRFALGAVGFFDRLPWQIEW